MNETIVSENFDWSVGADPHTTGEFEILDFCDLKKIFLAFA